MTDYKDISYIEPIITTEAVLYINVARENESTAFALFTINEVASN